MREVEPGTDREGKRPLNWLLHEIRPRRAAGAFG